VSHLPILPVLVPALTAVLLLVAARIDTTTQRAVSLISLLGLVGVAIAQLSAAASGEIVAYRLGDWDAPFGIVLVLDRLAAMMVALTSVVGLAAGLAAARGTDLLGRNFHALLHFQLMGLNGAFLTGDIFNLFVFFEILLIASYGLMLHGGGRERIGAGLHYVVLNLGGSAFFVIGLGIVYGSLGTLNMADLALRVAEVGPELEGIVQGAALLLLVVFALKAALLPLYFWLPRTYRAASAPVAALFAIMTKVGVYSIVRVYTVVFPADAPVLAGLPGRVLLPISLATIVFAAFGALAARTMRGTIANMLVVSVGVMMTAFAIFTEEALAAGMYYMVHSTLIVAALFLVAEMIGRQRGEVRDELSPAPQLRQAGLLGTVYFVSAAALGGLPPFGGFLGKVYVLQSAGGLAITPWIWAIVLLGSLHGIIAMARAGTAVFWNTAEPTEEATIRAVVAERDEAMARGPLPHPKGLVPTLLLLALVLGVSFGAGPVTRYTDAAAAQLADRETYIRTVLTEADESATTTAQEAQ
jgi:multicomponent K+:H+ antiporter subunit D